MEKFLIAFATDDGKTFMDRHFGGADFFDIYEINKDEANFLKRINNTVDEEEEVHADPKKAKGISHLLMKENVNVVAAKVFGPNIKRIRKKFVCVLMNDATLDDSIKNLCENIESVHNEWEKGEDRKHISLKNK